ncbi:MAG: glycosyltransferase family 4 protein [Thainema sp.]
MTNQQPQRVLMTTDFMGGVWVYTLELAQGLSQRGVEVAIASMGDLPSPEQRQALEQIAGVQLYTSQFKLEWMDNPWADVDRAGDWLLSLAEEVQPDVVHLNGYVHAALAWSVPVVVVGHSCVMSWWQAVKGEAAPASWQTYCDRVAEGIHQADYVIAPTQAMLDALSHHYATPDEPLPPNRVIYNGRSSWPFMPGAKQNVALAIGRLWDEAKNLSLLSQVASDLLWPVYVAGQKQHPQGSAIELLNVQELGNLSFEELRSWLSCAAIYVHPARYEPFGLAVLEAALSKCALVLSDIPSLRELWQDAALFVAPDDADGLRELLQGLMTDAARCRELAQKAYQRAQQYTPQPMVEEYVRVYQALLSSYSQPPCQRELLSIHKSPRLRFGVEIPPAPLEKGGLAQSPPFF